MLGRALLLTGPSGVGKTTVARYLQEILPEPWLFYEVDRAQPRPPENKPNFVTVENERRLTRATLASTRAYLEAGFSLIIEIGLFDEDDQRMVDDVFVGADTTVIALSCTQATLEQHLNERSDGADEQRALDAYERLVHASPITAMVIPTDDRSVIDVATAVAAHVNQ